jgi:hypothetical protein
MGAERLSPHAYLEKGDLGRSTGLLDSVAGGDLSPYALLRNAPSSQQVPIEV